MTPDEHALLAAVHVDPDDDVPRLVYADWLEERGGDGDAARAEFIRGHVRLATLDERDPEYDALGRRCRELLEANWMTWAAEAGNEKPLPRFYYGYRSMRRGFCDYTMLSDTDLSEPEFVAALARHTFTDINLYNLKADSPLPDWPRLRYVRKLSFYFECYKRDLDSVRRLIASPALCGLRELDLRSSDLSDDDAELVTHNPHFTNLRSLAVADGTFGPRFLAGLVASPVLQNLTALGLKSVSLPPGAILSLADAPLFSRLRELRLDRLRENDQDATGSLVALLSHPRLGPLERLGLRCNRLTDADFAACGVPGRFPRLNCLVLRDSSLTSETVARILASPHADRLVELNLSGNDLHGDWPGRLLRSAMTCVRRLNLEGCKLTPDVVEGLAASPTMGSVRELDLNDNPLGDAGAIALARSPYLRQLQVIRLQGCRIGPDGIRALAAAPFARRISSYDIARNRVEGEWLIEVGPEYFGWGERDISYIQSGIDMTRWLETIDHSNPLGNS